MRMLRLNWRPQRKGVQRADANADRHVAGLSRDLMAVRQRRRASHKLQQ
jgi:hypothetical protein